MKRRSGRLILAMLLPAAVLLGAPPATAQSPLDAAAIEAKVATAEGPLADAYRETDETVYSNGTKTIEHDYRRGQDYRYVFDSGSLHSERGSNNGDVWHMNENGQVVFDDPDDDGSPRELVPPKVTAIHTPVEGYLIASLDAQGRGRKQYIDGTSWRIVRRERITSDGTIIWTYEDVRLDNGRTMSHHVHVDDQAAKLASDLRVIAYQPGDVPASEVAIPSPRRALVTFPAGVTSVQLPAKFDGTQVFVRIMVGQRGLDFTLDTGASGIVIDSDVAKELGLPLYRRQSTVSAGRFETADAIIPQMAVGPLVMHDVAVQIAPQGWEMAPGIKTVGLLGFDFLAELGVTIDYEHQTVTVVPGLAFQAPTDPRTIPVDVRIGSGVPQTVVSVNGARGDRFILDTGGGGTFLITDYFARHHPEAFTNQTTNNAVLQFEGIGGEFDVKQYRMSRVDFSSASFRNWVGYRILTKGVYESDESDGIIGAEFLRLFTVSLNYGNSRIYLVPNRFGRAALGLK